MDRSGDKNSLINVELKHFLHTLWAAKYFTADLGTQVQV